MDYIKNSYSKTYGISISNPKFGKIYTSHTKILSKYANIYDFHLKLNFRKEPIYRGRQGNLIFWRKK